MTKTNIEAGVDHATAVLGASRDQELLVLPRQFVPQLLYFSESFKNQFGEFRNNGGCRSLLLASSSIAPNIQ